MHKKVAVVLSGCGHRDGSEITESILTLYSLDNNNLDYKCFAPNYAYKVVNHLNGMPTTEQRNILVEAARIARGKIEDIRLLESSEFEALILPGGFGVVYNLSTIGSDKEKATIIPEVESVIKKFFQAQKPIGAVCIAPALVVLTLKDKTKVTVTIGEDEENLISALGGIHQKCKTDDFVEDKDNKVFSCSAYMKEDPISKIGEGIDKMIKRIVEIL